MNVFEKRVLWIFGSNRDEVIREWRKLHNEEVNYLNSSPNIIWMIKLRRVRWAGHVERTGERRYAHRVLVGKDKEKSPLGRPWHRWEDNKNGSSRNRIGNSGMD